jgi:hypothetical protein
MKGAFQARFRESLRVKLPWTTLTMTTEEIVDEITSRDTHKVWRSSCEIISIGQSREKILPFITYLTLIREKTQGLIMGGGFASNQRFIDYAIRIIEFHKNSSECPCDLYTDKYECNDPNKEAEKGNITIETITRMEDKWVDFYTTKCIKCEQRFKAIEREGHYTWWQWTKLN